MRRAESQTPILWPATVNVLAMNGSGTRCRTTLRPRLSRRLWSNLAQNIGERDSAGLLCSATGIINELPYSLVSAQRESLPIETFTQTDQRGARLAVPYE